MDEQKMTVLESIIEDVATDLYNKWCKAMPENERSDEAFQALSKNAHETTIYVVQTFMAKFNAAAEELKNS